MSLEDAAVQKSAATAFADYDRREKPARRIRALIVDDIAENRAVLGVCCDQFGLAHDAVASGRDAVDAVRSGRFDLVFMDILMPGMDGVAATRAIRALPGPAGMTPVIAVTTAAERMDVLHYRANGVTEVVPKPINVARLMDAVETVLAEARRRRRSRTRELRLSA